MKECHKCRSKLPLEAFSKNRSRKDGRNSTCRECFNKYRKQHYEDNKERYLSWVGARKRKRKNEYLCEKAASSCTDCGIRYPNEPWLMEYDHLRDKKANIASLVKDDKAYKEEISKCEIVCIVCHRRRTAKRGNWKFHPIV